jgi:hypothetical protein
MTATPANKPWTKPSYLIRDFNAILAHHVVSKVGWARHLALHLGGSLYGTLVPHVEQHTTVIGAIDKALQEAWGSSSGIELR